MPDNPAFVDDYLFPDLPMAPEPQSLGLRWSSFGTGSEMVLPLTRLHGLHAAQHTPTAAPVHP